MKYKDLLLLLLTIIFVILSIFYIINVCNYNVKELFVTRYHTNVSSCEQGVLQSETLPSNDAKYTSEIMRNGGFINDYNEKYNCNNNYSSYMSSYSDVKKRDLLLAYKCINIKPSELIILINENSILNNNTYKITDSNLLVYNSTIKMGLASFTSVANIPFEVRVKSAVTYFHSCKI